MKAKLHLLILGTSFFLSTNALYAGGNPANGNNCIDTSLINPGAVCPAVYAPVCGCDGITYGNDCEAQSHGVTSYMPGACDSTNTNPGDSTNTGINDCIDSNLIDQGAICPTVYEPVCGCNAVTYDNDCIALAHGITNFTLGACGSNPDCYPPYFYYTFDSTRRVVSFMYSSYGISANGTINGAPAGGPNTNSNSPFTSLLWDFGDGNTSTDINPVHTYADSASGNYTVCLTVTDTATACTNQYCEVLYNYTNPCTVDFGWTYSNDSVLFTNNTPGIRDSNTIVIWSFGNGTVAGGYTNDSTGVSNPGCIYDSTGVYNPCVSVYNTSTGCFAMVCNTIQYFKTETGIHNNDMSTSGFSILPNPAANVFSIISNETMMHGKAVIYDMTGRRVLAIQLHSKNVNLQTDNFNNGVYFVTLENEKGRTTKKLVIQK